MSLTECSAAPQARLSDREGTESKVALRALAAPPEEDDSLVRILDFFFFFLNSCLTNSSSLVLVFPPGLLREFSSSNEKGL